MPWKPCAVGSHAWEPIRGWCGRYSCLECRVVGYRGVVMGEVAGRRAMDILPYRCPRCHGPTTKWRRKRVGEFGVRDGAQLCPSCA